MQLSSQEKSVKNSMLVSQGTLYNIIKLIRGFQPSTNFLERFRLYPNAPLLAFMLYRFKKFSPTDFGKLMDKYFVSFEYYDVLL